MSQGFLQQQTVSHTVSRMAVASWVLHQCREDVGIICKQWRANKEAVLETCIWMCNTYDSLKNPPRLCANEVIKYREMRGGKWVWGQGKNHQGFRMLSAFKSMPATSCYRGGVVTAGGNLRLKSSISPSFIQRRITVILDTLQHIIHNAYIQCDGNTPAMIQRSTT